MAEMHIFSRRYFFYGSLLAGAIPAGGFGSVASLTRLGYKSPNEKLNIASIAAGGKAESDIRGCARYGDNIVALCDPDAARAARTFQAYPNVPKYTDFRKMLDKEEKNIDAVIIACPDFMHGIAAMWCIERGKHVYVQKPMTRTVWEARMLTEAARKYKVATQMGNQGYCQEGPRVCAEMIWSGAIGDVTEVHAWTNRPIWKQGVNAPPKEDPIPETLDWDAWLGIAEKRPFSFDYLPFSWRGWYDFGCGALGDMACHVLGAPNMALLLGFPPTSVECIKKDPPGRNDYMYPMKSTIRFEFPARGSMPPLKLYWHDGVQGLPEEYWPEDIPKNEKLGDPPRGTMMGRGVAPAAGRGAANAAVQAAPAPQPPKPPATAAGRGGPDPYTAALNERTRPYNTPANSGVLYIGTKGYMTTGEYGGGPRIVPAAKAEGYQPPAPILPRTQETYADWIQSCKSGIPAASNFDVAGPFTEWIVMGCIACRVEGKLEWNSEKMQFTNNREANKYLKPTFRKGWPFSSRG